MKKTKLKSLDLTKELQMSQRNKEIEYIIGIDEVGRGAIAGPVCVGACKINKEQILNLQIPPNIIINDSKKLTKARRNNASEFINKNFETAILYGSNEDIDKYGISNVIYKLVKDLINKYQSSHTYFLIDGVFKCNFGENVETIAKGDSTYFSIAAASIVAKVERDRYMNELHKEFPMYGWNKNAGYGTKEHVKCLKVFSRSKYHRIHFLED